MEYNEHVGMSFDECCIKYKSIIDKVVSANCRRVVGNGSFSKDDIRQMALEGLMKAYKEFVGTHKTKFKYFIYDRMKWEILNNLKSNGTLVSFPQSFCVIWSIASKRGVTSLSQIDAVMKYKPKKYSKNQVVRAMEWYGYDKVTSLDKQLINNGKNEESKNIGYDTISGCEFDESVVIVEDFLSTLTSKQRQVVKLLMDEKTQKEISLILGISQTQVSRIEKSLKEAYIKYSGVDD